VAAVEFDVPARALTIGVGFQAGSRFRTRARQSVRIGDHGHGAAGRLYGDIVRRGRRHRGGNHRSLRTLISLSSGLLRRYGHGHAVVGGVGIRRRAHGMERGRIHDLLFAFSTPCVTDP